jgi:hypothetical protein
VVPLDVSTLNTSSSGMLLSSWFLNIRTGSQGRSATRSAELNPIDDRIRS